MLKTLVMLITLGSGTPKLLTFPLWESKKLKNAGNIPFWEVKMLKALVMLIILGLAAPKLLTLLLWESKSA